jgi:hypothetical protein
VWILDLRLGNEENGNQGISIKRQKVKNGELIDGKCCSPGIIVPEKMGES